MPLQVHGDDLMALAQSGKDRPEHLARPEPAVQQDHRPASSVRFEVEANAVDLGVLSSAGRTGGPIDGGHGAAPRVLDGGPTPVQTALSAGTHRRPGTYFTE